MAGVHQILGEAWTDDTKPGPLSYLIIGQPDGYELSFNVIWVENTKSYCKTETWFPRLVPADILEVIADHGERFELYDATFLAARRRSCPLPWGF